MLTGLPFSALPEQDEDRSGHEDEGLRIEFGIQGSRCGGVEIQHCPVVGVSNLGLRAENFGLVDGSCQV